MEWTEPFLLNREFRLGDGQSTVVARLGIPRPTERDREWTCAFQLSGSDDDRIRHAHGVDGPQAVLIAAGALRMALDRLPVDNFVGEAYQLILPRCLPSCFGLEFHQFLCSLVDEEMDKKQKDLTRRRLSGRRRKQAGGS